MEEESKLSQQYLPPLPTTLNDDVSSFNSLLHVNNWFINPSSINQNQNQNFMFQSFNPFTNDFDFGSEQPCLLNSNPSLFHLSSNPEFVPTRAVELSEGGFNHNAMCVVGEQCHVSVASNSVFFNQGCVFQHQGSKVLAPAVVPPQMVTALSQGPVDRMGALEVRTATRLGTMERKRKIGLNDDSHDDDVDDDDDVEIDKYEENVNNGGNNFEGNNVNDDDNGGMHKGKKKKKVAMAKNLMAERRRRKRLNDRLYMLRSVVPKISKMDRASILGDAIEYLKDLIQKVNDLHNELGSTPFGSNPTPSSSFHPVTPSLPTLPFRVKDELCLSSLTTPKSQSPKVEVRLREGKAIDVHMLCACKPGLFLSTMRALDSLGFDVQQAVISGFNDFVLDVYRAEQCRGLDLLPEQIKTVLLQAADFNGGMM